MTLEIRALSKKVTPTDVGVVEHSPGSERRQERLTLGKKVDKEHDSDERWSRTIR